MKMKIKNITLTTPLGEIYIKDKPCDDDVQSVEEITDFCDAFGDKMATLNWIRLPTQNDQIYVIPKEVLNKSILSVSVEKVKE